MHFIHIGNDRMLFLVKVGYIWAMSVLWVILRYSRFLQKHGSLKEIVIYSHSQWYLNK